MRTKTLLLTAALSAAGVATSMAQAVYSVNAVGYVNTTLQPGFNLISNPLTAANNSVASLFADVKIDGAQIFKFDNTTKSYAAGTFTYDELAGAWLGAGGADPTKVNVLPGEGVFVRVPSAVTVTFIGDVSQGTGANALKTDIKAGLNVLSSQVPQAGAADADLKLPAPTDGDQLYRYDSAAQTYNVATYDELSTAWLVAGSNANLGLADPKMKLGVGDAFFYSNVGAAKTWTREFSVNQ